MSLFSSGQFGQRVLKTERGRLFFCVVLLPAVLIGLYLLIFCADEYQSTAIVTIDESSTSQSNLGLLESLAVNGGGPKVDEQILQAFVVSPDLLLALENELSLRKHYSQSWDFLFGLDEDDTIEDFLAFYKKKVSVKRDADSGLLQLSVRAYTAEYAQRLAQAVLIRSEEFINSSSNTIAAREMEFALSEIERSQALLKKAKNALLVFQDKHALVSPDSEGQSLISIVYEMESELARSQAELSQASQFLNNDAPQVLALKGKIEALQKEIVEQKQRLIGAEYESGNEQMNKLSARFQELNMDVETALSLYKSALGAYEVARMQAGKQLKHLVVVSRPYLPEDSTRPKRLYWWFTGLVVLCALYGIIRLIALAVVEHND